MNFLTFKYWFNMNPGALIPWAQKGLIFFILMLFGLAVYVKYFEVNNILKLPKFALKKLFSFFIANGIIGLVLLFFTYQQITLFSSRFWFIAWVVSMALYLYFLDKKIKSNTDKKAQYKKEDERKKYIP